MRHAPDPGRVWTDARAVVFFSFVTLGTEVQNTMVQYGDLANN